MERMHGALVDYFRCPEHFVRFELGGELSGASGFFQFGQGTICYGRCASAFPARHSTDSLHDAAQDVQCEGERLRLPFDLSHVVENLRRERYSAHARTSWKTILCRRASGKAYYCLRPLLPLAVRKPLQRAYLRGWDKLSFPHWPVDCTVESIIERTMVLALLAGRLDRMPFIWFWPHGTPSCTMMTHDVEAVPGQQFCAELMHLDDAYGIKSSFQIVPEGRYKVSESFLNSIRNQGFEVNIHDLNHDGRLYQERQEFLRRTQKINQYAKAFQALGFRAGAMYRNLEWYEALEFSYDMSVPNVAHLDPQRGGCCTIMPYFIGNILELPLTTIQDYSLFYILGEYSTQLWKQQIALLLQKHGLISFIIHPDYLLATEAQRVYAELLHYLCQLRSERQTWIALPREVDAWWRMRSQMQLVPAGGTWRIEGPGKERARLAYAILAGATLSYQIDQDSCSAQPE
jgi:hypothetical protein